jgi:hypothetical protein
VTPNVRCEDVTLSSVQQHERQWETVESATALRTFRPRLVNCIWIRGLVRSRSHPTPSSSANLPRRAVDHTTTPTTCPKSPVVAPQHPLAHRRSSAKHKNRALGMSPSTLMPVSFDLPSENGMYIQSKWRRRSCNTPSLTPSACLPHPSSSASDSQSRRRFFKPTCVSSPGPHFLGRYKARATKVRDNPLLLDDHTASEVPT